MNKWIAEFDLEDGDTMPEHMDLEYKGAKIDFHCRPLEQEPQTFKWCTDCKEYDQEKHCCHRWSKVIRDTVEEMKKEQEPKTGHWIDNECTNCGYEVEPWNNTNYCPNCGAKMESEVDNGNDD